jgi:2-polyprenyl-3-methyl-5-hydroxy-6-metoxy-1,4-benzoquinol methylase
VTATLAATNLACPVCAEALEQVDGTLACGHGHRYPIELGIPDFRRGEDPDRAEDLDQARRLDAIAEQGFAAMLRARWQEMDRAPQLVERFLTSDLAEEKGEPLVGAIERGLPTPLRPGVQLLEVGCGSGWFAMAARARGADVVAGDVSMSWLVLARRRLVEAGAGDVQLVCFDAAQPPFEADSFDVVVAADVIEHVPDPAAFVRGCSRVLRAGGLLFVSTPNRFSLGLEPHVRLWGVGYLPRGLARRYVRQVRRSPYDHVWLLSAAALRHVLRGAGFDVRFVTPRIPDSRHRFYRGFELTLIRVYNRVRTNPVARKALQLVGPFFHVYATKREEA